VRLQASAGWGKTSFARAAAARAATSLFCTFAGVRDEADARARFARAGGAVDAATVVEAWKRGEFDVLALDDVHELLRVGALAIIDDVLAAAPSHKLLIVSSDLRLAVDVSRTIGPHEVLTLTRDDLVLTDAERREAIGQLPIAAGLLERAADLSAGWPIAVLLFERFVREGILAKALGDLGGPLFAELHEYMAYAVFSELSAVELDVVTICAVLGNATDDDVSACLGFDARDVLVDLVRRRLYVVHEDETYAIAPLTAHALRAKRATNAHAILRLGAIELIARGSLLRAAELAIAAKDEALAADALDGVGPPTMGLAFVRYLIVARNLGFAQLFRTRWPFVLILASQMAAAYSDVLYGLVLAYCERLEPNIDARTRFTADIAIACVTTWTFRTDEAHELFEACKIDAQRFPDEPERAQMIEVFLFYLRMGDGRFREAEEHARAARVNLPEYELAFSFIILSGNYGRAMYEGRANDLARMQEIVQQQARLFRDPIVLAHGLAYGALVAYMFDPNVMLPTLLVDVEATLETLALPWRRRWLQERYSRPLQSTELPTHLNCIIAIDAAFSQSDVEVARRLVAVALAGFDRLGQPIGRIFGRVVAALVPGNEAAEYLRDADAIARSTESQPLQAELTELVAGKDRAGPFVIVRKRLRMQPLMREASTIRLRLLAGTVERGGVDIAVRPREWDVLSALAIERGPISVETLLEELWPGAEPVAATRALRMTVYRLRRALDDADVLRAVSGGYRLSEDVAVDVLEAERAVAAIGQLPSLVDRDRHRLETVFAEFIAPRPVARTESKWSRVRETAIADVRHRVGLLLGEDALQRALSLHAVETAEALLRFDPLDEPAVELLVRGLIATGDAPEARRRYRSYADALAAEHDAEPAFRLEPLFA